MQKKKGDELGTPRSSEMSASDHENVVEEEKGVKQVVQQRSIVKPKNQVDQSFGSDANGTRPQSNKVAPAQGSSKKQEYNSNLRESELDLGESFERAKPNTYPPNQNEEQKMMESMIVRDSEYIGRKNGKDLPFEKSGIPLGNQPLAQRQSDLLEHQVENSFNQIQLEQIQINEIMEREAAPYSRRESHMKEIIQSQINTIDIDNGSSMKRKATDIYAEEDNMWVKDAANGLSYTKMKYVVDQKHPRMKGETGRKESYPWCSTNTGWYCCCSTTSDLEGLGAAVSGYFKMLKFLMILYFIFIIVSIPAYYFYARGNETQVEENSINYYLSTLSLGNIGSSETSCNSAFFNITEAPATRNRTKKNSTGNGKGKNNTSGGRMLQDTDVGDEIVIQDFFIDLFCPYGTMISIIEFGISDTDSTCFPDGTSGEELQNITTLARCDLYSMGDQYNHEIVENFNETCLDQESCSYELALELFNEECLDILEYRTNSTTGLNAQVYLQAQCQDFVIEIPYTDYSIERSVLGILVVCLDIFIILVFVIGTNMLLLQQRRDNQKIQANHLLMEDFTVEVKNLPSKHTYNSVEELKALLWNHMENVAGMESQKLFQLLKTQRHSSEIVNIHFGLTDYGSMSYLIIIYRYMKELYLLDRRIQNDQNENNKASYEYKKLKIYDKIEREIINYRQYEERNHSEVVNAFVQFRSMEGAARAYQAYDKGACKRCCLSCWCRGDSLRRKRFYGNWLKVKRAVNPDQILWHNLSVGSLGRFFRILGAILVTIILIALTFYLVILAQDYEAEFQLQFPSSQSCVDGITETQALEDQLKEPEERGGYMYCYCLEQFNLINIKVNDIVFDDGEKWCRDWLQIYTLVNSFTYIISLGISTVNVILKIILRYVSRLERAHTKTQETYSSMVKLFAVQYINTGIIILVVNLNLGIYIDWFPIFSGRYREFSVDWYRVVGSTLTLTMILNIFTPYLSYYGWLFLNVTKRCCDRRCSCDEKRTKKIIQKDYEDMYIGPEFLMEFRLSQILTNNFVTITYSAGIPFLYMVQFSSLFITYWLDKMLFLKYYKKPPSYDVNLTLDSIKLLKYAVLIHFIIGFIMYSNSTILSSRFYENSDFFTFINSNNYYFNATRFAQLHTSIYAGAFAVLCVLYCLKEAIVSCLMCCFKLICTGIKDRLLKLKSISDDFYEELPVFQLFKILEVAIKEKKEYEDNNKNGHFRNSDSILLFLQKLEKKISDMDHIRLKYISDNNIEELDRKKALEELIKKAKDEHVASRINTTLFTYDVKDIDIYNGVTDVQKFIREREKTKKAQ